MCEEDIYGGKFHELKNLRLTQETLGVTLLMTTSCNCTAHLRKYVAAIIKRHIKLAQSDRTHKTHVHLTPGWVTETLSGSWGGTSSSASRSVSGKRNIPRWIERAKTEHLWRNNTALWRSWISNNMSIRWKADCDKWMY